MHNYLIVLKIPRRWYSGGDVLCAAVGQADLRDGGAERRASGAAIGMNREL
jgi:hypothetical protein